MIACYISMFTTAPLRWSGTGLKHVSGANNYRFYESRLHAKRVHCNTRIHTSMVIVSRTNLCDSKKP